MFYRKTQKALRFLKVLVGKGMSLLVRADLRRAITEAGS